MGNLDEASPLTDQHYVKGWEMIVNPDVDGFTKTLNHQKIAYSDKRKKQQTTENQNNKYQNKASWRPSLYS